MVSFSCEACGDVLLKKKLDAHRRQCTNASYTCLDCMVNFENNDYRAHTSCISEQQKYEGALYRPLKYKTEKQKGKSTIPNSESIAPITKSPVKMNVFDFLDSDQTSLLSGSEYLTSEPWQTEKYVLKSPHVFREISGNKSLNNSHHTSTEKKLPVRKPKIEPYRDKIDSGDIFNGTKRKHMHVEPKNIKTKTLNETQSVVLHTQLTSDLTQLMRRPSTFPPSPDLSGGESVEPSPISPTVPNPLTKTKSVKKRKETFSIGNGVKAFITAKPLPKKSSTRNQNPTKPQPLLLEDHPKMKRRSITDSTSDKNEGDLVVYQPMSKQAQLLFGIIDKGLESPRGVSMSKALKKLHRERELLGFGAGKVANEKELWKDLRVRRNDRGELVLFV